MQLAPGATARRDEGMQDLAFLALTVVGFAALAALLAGVERL